ncbi:MULTISPECIES: Hsp20/alpha crystallin family protein [Hyphomicrobiales]|jgi:HSP20 family protein|uniref:Heat-shock protein n=1 Tax=Methylocystis echinoides TaxID=29468 RepID=A0A9W6LUM4_9HYPH|nr:Hsp20/alpha crystallin family protein [Methylocystis echinoides]RTM08471.1 MAG: Hsp20/alpha crystallin family protein [Hyphomicrobiales bacterium]GLI95960.1 heat-shock protein [Methylocystis echinoides]
MAAQDTSVGEAAESTRDAPVFVPPADIIEDQSSLLMVLDLPGADPESLDVTLDKRLLRIAARSVPSRPEGYTLQHAEYWDGNYERSFVISEPVDVAKIEAIFKDGVLRLTLPKATPAPAAKISVKAA